MPVKRQHLPSPGDSPDSSQRPSKKPATSLGDGSADTSDGSRESLPELSVDITSVEDSIDSEGMLWTYRKGHLALAPDQECTAFCVHTDNNFAPTITGDAESPQSRPTAGEMDTLGLEAFRRRA